MYVLSVFFNRLLYLTLSARDLLALILNLVFAGLFLTLRFYKYFFIGCCSYLLEIIKVLLLFDFCCGYNLVLILTVSGPADTPALSTCCGAGRSGLRALPDFAICLIGWDN